jgi:hypothetical protein
MGDDPVEKIIEEVVKQLPVKQIYDDGASGATKQVGHTLSDVAKAVRLSLFPIQVLAALQDRAERFIDRSIRRVPNERRISPAPQVVGPVLEGIRYETEGTPIDEMFSQLLSRAVDSERVNEAHPAYPILIKQLSTDEAKILSMLHTATYDYVHTRSYDAATALFTGLPTIEVDALPKTNLSFPKNVPFYFEHLYQLGLAGIFQVGNQEPLYDGPPQTKQIGIRVRSKYRLTELGSRFVKACTAA